MRTTLKRGIGRGASFNGDGGLDGTGFGFPALAPVALYRQPPPIARSGRSVVTRVLGWSALVLAVIAGGIAGGAYLYLHETVAAVATKSVDVKKALKSLKVALPGEPATALVIGYDRRANDAKGTPSRSDTLMLVRADPDGKTISLLSFPRDLSAEIRCPGQSTYVAKINAAYADCGTRGTVETVRALTGVPINYIITVNFRGFRQLVDKIGGVWMDIDRRYFNDRGGSCEGCYATINLRPGYQRLTGLRALDFVRYRHTDSDLYRNARQQLFVSAFKDQVKSSVSLLKLPRVIKVITQNIEVGQGGGKDVSAKTVLRYAALAYSLPPGRVFQARIDGLEGSADLYAAPENIERAVREFRDPDVESPRKANAVALNEKLKVRTPPPRDTSVLVLNGNGVEGSASTASYLLGQRGYQILSPAGGLTANAPSYDYFRTEVYFDARRVGAKPAARKLANLFGSADVKKLTPRIRLLSNRSLVVVVLGQTFHGRLASAPVDQTPKRQPASVVEGGSDAIGLLREYRQEIDFPLMVPTKIDRSSSIDGEMPLRVYPIDPGKEHQAVRLTYRHGLNEYWGVQMTDWEDPPVLEGRNFVRKIGGRTYELYYNGPRLHMVVLKTDGASYWVVNTLLDRLSNETMIAIAKGLRPLAKLSRA